jgi:hypothetical protein
VTSDQAVGRGGGVRCCAHGVSRCQANVVSAFLIVVRLGKWGISRIG